MTTANGNGKLRSWSQLPKSGVLVVTGHRGEGKTALALWLAERFHKTRRLVVAFDFTEVARKAMPRWVKHAKSVAEVGKLKPALIIVDEAALKVHARRHQSADNIEWTRLVAVARHKEHLLLFIAQHSRQIDVGLVMDADLLLMKRPSILHLRSARPEITPEMQEAFNGFSKMTPARAKRSVLVVDYHYGRKGWLSNGLPTFWKDKLSRAFAAVDLQGAEVDTKRRKARAALGARKSN